MDFKDMVAIVTGGSQGLGRAFCEALLKQGMKVCICDIKEESAKEFMDDLKEDKKANALFQRCDVTSLEEMRSAFVATLSRFGRIDVVVNNAGILHEREWRKMLDINVVGVVHGVHLAFEYMDKSNGGRGGTVVNTSSIVGLHGHYLAPVYSASKHAIVGLTLSYGSEYFFKRYGVKVNAICPTGIDTELMRNLPVNCTDEKDGNKLLNDAATQLLKPEDVAEALMTMLKDGKNGALLRVNPSGNSYEDRKT